jgi:hypothetical protein
MAQYLRWRVRGIYQLNDFGRQFEQAELLHLVCHGERHAALVLLCGHVGLDGDAVATFFPPRVVLFAGSLICGWVSLLDAITMGIPRCGLVLQAASCKGE